MIHRHAAPAACLLALLALGSTAQAQPPQRPLPDVPGPYIGLDAKAFDGVPTFGPADKLVMTYYFTWYDTRTKAHIVDADGSDALTTHPASLDDYSYRSVSWHRRQFEDMMAAGIDVALPVYWGAPSEHAPGAGMKWSYDALGPMVEALDALVKDGKRPPRLGLFYDTSTLQFNSWHTRLDLTTEYGRDWFTRSIRDFFSRIPPRHWALYEGHPIVGLYAAAFATGHDQHTIDDMKARFARDFGGKVPYVIREISWNVKADNTYAWGGAVKPNFLGVAEIGPGYDHSAVEGRTPLVVDREGGAFYERAWQKAIQRKPKIVILETWNEHHEGTDIAASREYGRQYIDLTRKYVDLWRQGWTPPPVKGRYTGQLRVSVGLGPTDHSDGIRRIDVQDGQTAPADLGGSPCRKAAPNPTGGRYLYFAIDDSFKWSTAMDVTVEVDYLDAPGGGSFSLEYDSNDPRGTFNGAYTAVPDQVALEGTNTWKTARFTVPNARFAGLQNGGADFRLVVSAPELAVRSVVVKHRNYGSLR